MEKKKEVKFPWGNKQGWGFGKFDYLELRGMDVVVTEMRFFGTHRRCGLLLNAPDSVLVELCEFCVVRRAGDKIKQYSCCWSGSPLLSSLSSHSAYSDDINACVSTLFLSVVQRLVLSPHAMKGPDLKHSWGPALWNLHMPTWVCFRYMCVFRLHSPKTCMLGSLVILN